MGTKTADRSRYKNGLDLGAAAEQADDLEEGNIDVHEAQAGDESFKGRLVPEGFEISLEVVDSPGVLPGKNHQEQADFERKDCETKR